jgi:hypothetical protein
MAESRHTPGPWRVNSGHGELWIESVKHGRVICAFEKHRTGQYTEQDGANAEFIVRACNAHDELLAACEALISQYDAPGGPALTEQVEAVRAAIAKARGEVQ